MNELFKGFNFSYMAIFTYVLYSLKGIPIQIFNFILDRFSFSITVSTQDISYYREVSQILLELDKKILNNNIKVQSEYKGRETIGYGTYFFMIDKFTICWVNVNQREKGNEAIDYINIRIIGYKQTEWKDKLLDRLEHLFDRCRDKYLNVITG